MPSPIKLSKDEIEQFRRKLTDRSWAIISVLGSGRPTDDGVGPIFRSARDFEGLAEAMYPCFIVGQGAFGKGLFLENPNINQVIKFCAVTSTHLFVTNGGYTNDKGDVPVDDPLDYDWLEVGEVSLPVFDRGYFVVAMKYHEEDQNNNIVAVMAEKLIAFKIPAASAVESDDDDDEED